MIRQPPRHLVVDSPHERTLVPGRARGGKESVQHLLGPIFGLAQLRLGDGRGAAGIAEIRFPARREIGAALFILFSAGNLYAGVEVRPTRLDRVLVLLEKADCRNPRAQD